MPVPIRESLVSLSRWNINTEAHARFCEFCRCSGNAKDVATKDVGFVAYADHLGKAKTHRHWKARGLAVGTPSEAILQSKSCQDAARLIALRVLFLSQPGDVITADLANRDSFIAATSEAWLSQ